MGGNIIKDAHFNVGQMEWLKQFFSKSKISFQPLTPDASKRRYYRVLTGNEESFVVCVEEAFSPWRHPFLVQRHLWCQHQLPVPKVIAFSGPLGLTLLQDLEDVSLQGLWAEAGAILWGSNPATFFYPAPLIPRAQRVSVTQKIIEDLCRIQSLPMAFFEQRFDRGKLGFEWGWTFKYLIQPLLSYVQVKSEVREKIFRYWSQWTYDISLYLERNIAVPCHRDLHSRNIMMFDGQHYFIDFQDARLGTIYYDVTSFVFDAYLNYDPIWEQQVIDCYHTLSVHKWDERLFGAQAMQRLFKAAGSFASFFVRQNDKRYLGYLPQTLQLLKMFAYERGYGGSLSKEFLPLIEDLMDYWSIELE
jgi:aminoglycoside/choline kinase family phosphotransferase